MRMDGFFTRHLLLLIILSMFILAAAFNVGAETGLQPFDHFGGFPGGSFVKGGYAYLIQARTLTVLDITGNEFKRVNYLALREEPQEVIIEGDTAYLFTLSSDSCVSIVDLSNPVSPQLIATAPIYVSYSARFFVARALIFISSGDKLSIYDASDPQNVVLKSTTNKNVNDVYVRNQLVYAACSDGLLILDISDPASPRQLAHLATPGVDDIWLQDQQALLLGLRRTAPYIDLTVVDVADSSKPVQSSMIALNNSVRSHDGFVTASPGMAYIGAGTNLYLVDIASPATPVQRGIYTHVNGFFTSLQSVYPYVYAAMGTTDYGFVRVDVSDAANPQQSAVLFEPWDTTFIFSAGTALYVASAEHLMIWDWSDPFNPFLAGADSRWPFRSRLYVHGNLLYAICDDSLHVIDVTNPAQMQLKSVFMCANDEISRCILADNSHAWLTAYNSASNKSTLYILDVRDPVNLQVKGKCSFSGKPRDLALSGDHTLAAVAYSVSDTDQGLRLIDVTNPAAPVLQDSASSKGKPTCVWIADTLAFVGSYIGSGFFPVGPYYIEAYNLSNPVAITQIGETTGAGTIADLEVSDGRIYASIPGGSIYGFDYYNRYKVINFNLIYRCHSPSSIFLALMHSSNKRLGFTNDGYFDLEDMMVSASEGIYVQYQESANSIVQRKEYAPRAFLLSQNYPNPFNPITQIEYNVVEKCQVLLEVFDVLGRNVATLVDGEQDAGTYRVPFSAHGRASAIYFYRIKMKDFVDVKKMIMLE